MHPLGSDMLDKIAWRPYSEHQNRVVMQRKCALPDVFSSAHAA